MLTITVFPNLPIKAEKCFFMNKTAIFESILVYEGNRTATTAWCAETGVTTIYIFLK